MPNAPVTPAASAITEIALFPIPGLVAFPGATVPLHVFEPRYRALVKDCVEADRWVGLCHTRKVISEPRRKQDLRQALQSNQATYQPHDVLSAGACEIVKVTEDGRLHAVVNVRHRYRILQEIQTLPYRIVRSEPFEDDEDVDSAMQEKAHQFQQEITWLLWEVIENQDAVLARRIDWSRWLDYTPTEYSFRLFDYLRLDADLMQQLLEIRSACQRLEVVRAVLLRAGKQ